MSQVRLRILGEALIEVGGKSVTPSATHLFALLLYVALERGRAISRAELAALLFSEESPSVAAHNLRQLLYRARRLGLPIASKSLLVCLPPELVEDDVKEALAGNYPERTRSGSISLALLPHYTPPTRPLSDWLERFREHLQHQLLRRLADDLQNARRGADWRSVEALATASLELDPYNETATLALAEALARTGSKHKAVGMLHQFEQEVGRASESLTLPSRLLKRRISEPPISGIAIPDTPLIGRSREMARLTSLWDIASQGHCSTAVVIGEKSIGKSRLIAELTSSIRLDASGTIVSTRRLPADRHRPMSLFADICKQLICIPGAAGCAPSSVAFLNRLTEAPKRLATLRVDEFEAEYSETGVRKAIIDLFACVSAERPLLCHVDDAHHLDEISCHLLRQVREQLSASPLLILLSGQNIEVHFQQSDSRLQLSPLDVQSSALLASELITRGRLSLDAESVDWCISTALGNPGHLELLLAHAARSPEVHEAPPDLVTLTDHRLEALSMTATHAIQACVVFGVDCHPKVIAALTGLDSYQLLTALQELDNKSLLVATPNGLGCRSALVEGRVLLSIPKLVRTLLHSRAANYLERRNKDAIPSQALAWRVAAHWDAAGEFDSALHWRGICWRHLIAIGQPMAAAASIRAQLNVVQRPERRSVLLDVLIDALHSAGETPALLRALDERIALSDHIHDSRSIRSALAFDSAEASIHNGADPTPYFPHLRQHVRSSHLDSLRRSRAARLLMIAADNAIDPDFARDVYVMHDGVQPHDSQSLLLHHHARLIYHSVFGERGAALACADALDLLANNGECSWSRMTSLYSVSLARRIVDDMPPAYTKLEKCFEDCQAAGMDSFALLLSARIATFLLDDGRLDEAVRWGRRSRELADKMRLDRHSGDFLTSQIDLALVTGRFARAQSLVASMPHTWTVSASPRLSKEYLVYRTRVNQFGGHANASDEDLNLLLTWHDRSRQYSRHDDHVEVLWVALVARGRLEEASAMLTEYVAHSRREARPCNYLLRLRTAADSAWKTIDVLQTDAVSGKQVDAE